MNGGPDVWIGLELCNVACGCEFACCRLLYFSCLVVIFSCFTRLFKDTYFTFISKLTGEEGGKGGVGVGWGVRISRWSLSKQKNTVQSSTKHQPLSLICQPLI